MDGLYFASWLGYYLLHSLLAADRVKTFFRKKWPAGARWYRLAFNAVSLAGLLVLIWLGWMHAGAYIVQLPGFLRIAGALLLAGGGLLGWVAFGAYSSAEFFGTDVLKPGETAPPVLAERGLNAWVRHPLYSATLLIVLGVVLLWPLRPVLSAAAATIVYLPLGIYWEEKKLIRQFGDAYRAYQKRVKRLIPGIW